MTNRDVLIVALRQFCRLGERLLGEPVTLHLETKTEWLEIKPYSFSEPPDQEVFALVNGTVQGSSHSDQARPYELGAIS